MAIKEAPYKPLPSNKSLNKQKKKQLQELLQKNKKVTF